MNRVAIALLFGGLALLVSWAIAPAAPVTSLNQTPDAAATAQASAIVTDVNAQVDRMRARLSSSMPAPTPVRDPFRYGRRPVSERPRPTGAPAEVEALPSVILPTLVAMLDESAANQTGRRAVLAFHGNIHIVAVGETVGAFTVRAIDERSVDLVDAGAAHVYRITLQ